MLLYKVFVKKIDANEIFKLLQNTGIGTVATSIEQNMRQLTWHFHN